MTKVKIYFDIVIIFDALRLPGGGLLLTTENRLPPWGCKSTMRPPVRMPLFAEIPQLSRGSGIPNYPG